jgi:hypothetical protein
MFCYSLFIMYQKSKIYSSEDTEMNQVFELFRLS